MEQLKEYIDKNYVSKDIIEFIVNTSEQTKNYSRERIIEDLKLALKGEQDGNIWRINW